VLRKEEPVKASLLLGTLILTAAGLVAGAFPLLSTSAQEPMTPEPVPFLAAAVECPTFDGTLELYHDDVDADAIHATVTDEAGVIHTTDGFGITGETLIIAPDVITRSIELGSPPDGLTGQQECFIFDLKTEERNLTQEDINAWSLDPSLTGAYAEIETVITGLVWLAP